MIWLLFDVPPDFEFQLGRANTVSDALTECSAGHCSIDDDDESWAMTTFEVQEEFASWVQWGTARVLLVQCSGGRNSPGVAILF